MPRLLQLVLLSVAIALAVTPLNFADFNIFYSAALTLRQGINPYTVDGFYSPLFVLIYFLPLTILPIRLAAHVNSFVIALAYFAVFWRWSRQRASFFVPMLLAPFLPFTLSLGNIEWMPLLATIVNPLIGVWLALAKPQMGGVLAAILLIIIWRTYGWRLSVLSAVVLLICYSASYLAGMRWTSTANLAWNLSPFPWLVPLGIWMTITAISRLSTPRAIVATPCLSPYLGSIASFAGLLCALTQSWQIWLVVVVGWIWQIYLRFHAP